MSDTDYPDMAHSFKRPSVIGDGGLSVATLLSFGGALITMDR
jgi:hypothetical protein